MIIPMWLFWLILMVVFLILESLTMGLSTVWCAVGCLVSAILAAFEVDVWIQIVAMVVVSLALFIMFIVWIKPNMKDFNKLNIEPTNADRFIGKEGVVIEDIDSVELKGQVKVLGQVWSAVADHNIAAGAHVRVKSIQGVRLEVEII